jgi:two-component system, OmpR family, sensor kinase
MSVSEAESSHSVAAGVPPPAQSGRQGGYSLATRLLVATALLAAIVACVFAVLVLATASLRRATEREERSKEITAATLVLDQLILDLHTGLRAFVVSGQRRLLLPWTRARPGVGAQFRELEGLVADDPAEARRVRQLRRLVDAYQRDYGAPLIAIARENRAAARTPEALSEGDRRIGAIRRRLTSFLTLENERASAAAEAAQGDASRAVGLGIAGLGISAALILLFGVYLARAIARPVRDVAAGASRLAAGDLSARLPGGGPGEVGELTRAFNAMAGSLEQGRLELEAQNQRLRESDRLKSELVNIVSHELRTPLTSILGFTSVLRTRSLGDDERGWYLKIVEEQARRLATLIEDFLDLQRIEEGHLELKQELVDLAAVLRKEASVLAEHSARHTLKFALPDDRLTVYGDESRLTQVIGNLVSNAIKYSPGGGEVEVAGERDADFVEVRVRDHGVGIPVEQQDRIFTKFFRGDAASRGIAGTGLGLALAREIVEAHGGRLGFTSAKDAGSTFWVRLPAAPSGV